MRYLRLLFLFLLLGCNQTSKEFNHEAVKVIADTPTTTATAILPDTSNQFIYDFMKVVIEEHKLNLTHGLTIEPQQCCDLSGDDYSFLKTLLVETKKQEGIKDRSERGRIKVFSLELPKCLTQADIIAMLEQKKKMLPAFKWDNSRLGFDLANNKNWYCFSIPLFSTDKKKAVMMIKDLCRGLCGTGTIVLFRKEKNKWRSEIINLWMH